MSIAKRLTHMSRLIKRYFNSDLHPFLLGFSMPFNITSNALEDGVTPVTSPDDIAKWNRDAFRGDFEKAKSSFKVNGEA